MVTIDYLTRWLIAAAVKEITAETTGDFLFQHIIKDHGISKYILTDRGSNFTSQYLQSFIKHIRAYHSTSTVHQLQVNGLVERMNQTLAQTIMKLWQGTKKE